MEKFCYRIQNIALFKPESKLQQPESFLLQKAI